MTIEELAKRVDALEAEVRALREQIAAGAPPKKSVLNLFGRYADDPTFEDAVRIGRVRRLRERREVERADRDE